MTGVDPGCGTPGCTRKHHGHRPEYPPPTGKGREAVVADMLDTLLRVGMWGLDRSREHDLHAYALACKAALTSEGEPGVTVAGQKSPESPGRHPDSSPSVELDQP